MADTGALNPSAGSTSNAVGTKDWSNPTNIYSSNDADASASQVGVGTVYTYYLKAQTFGAAVPTGATINGIKVEIEKMSVNNSATNYCQDSEVKIIKADGTIGTTNRADTTTKWGTSDAYATHGSNSDLWGETWTSADINDADFGVAISAKIVVPNKANNTIYIDHIRITVYYTVAGNQ